MAENDSIVGSSDPDPGDRDQLGSGAIRLSPEAQGATDRLVMALIAGTTTLGVYPPSHPQSEESIGRLSTTLAEALRARHAEEISILAIDEDLAVDGNPWKRTLPMRASLVRAFRRAAVDRVTVRLGCEPDELQALLLGLSARQALEESDHVSLGQIRLAGDSDSTEQAAGSLEHRYDQVMNWLRAFERDPSASFGELDEAVWELLEAVWDGDRECILMASLESDLDRLFRHSIHVCLTATQIARALDIRGAALHDIALAALLHDVGYLDLAPELVWRKRSLDAIEERTVRLHPELGAARLAALDGVPPLCLIAAYEHHLAWNGEGGYPEMAAGRRPHLVARITAVADHWDALSSAGARLPAAERRKLALRGLRARAGGLLDPELVRVLAG